MLCLRFIKLVSTNPKSEVNKCAYSTRLAIKTDQKLSKPMSLRFRRKQNVRCSYLSRLNWINLNIFLTCDRSEHHIELFRFVHAEMTLFILVRIDFKSCYITFPRIVLCVFEVLFTQCFKEMDNRKKCMNK